MDGVLRTRMEREDQVDLAVEEKTKAFFDEMDEAKGRVTDLEDAFRSTVNVLKVTRSEVVRMCDNNEHTHGYLQGTDYAIKTITDAATMREVRI